MAGARTGGSCTRHHRVRGGWSFASADQSTRSVSPADVPVSPADVPVFPADVFAARPPAGFRVPIPV
jgi:hypothetical protein